MPNTILNLTLQGRRFAAIHALSGILIRVCRGGPCVEKRFHCLQMLLDALPLPTNEFKLATSRLNNAHRHLKEDESGAALYELQLLLRSLVAGNS